jgi:hypothetical protein
MWLRLRCFVAQKAKLFKRAGQQEDQSWLSDHLARQFESLPAG